MEGSVLLFIMGVSVSFSVAGALSLSGIRGTPGSFLKIVSFNSLLVAEESSCVLSELFRMISDTLSKTPAALLPMVD